MRGLNGKYGSGSGAGPVLIQRLAVSYGTLGEQTAAQYILCCILFSSTRGLKGINKKEPLSISSADVESGPQGGGWEDKEICPEIVVSRVPEQSRAWQCLELALCVCLAPAVSWRGTDKASFPVQNI